MPTASHEMIFLAFFLMAVIAIISVVAGGAITSYSGLNVQMNQGVYYDYGGNAKKYANLTDVAEHGTIVCGDYGLTAMWDNHTGYGLNVPYQLYYDTNHQYPIMYKDIITDVGIGQQVPSDNAKYWADLPKDNGLNVVDAVIKSLMGGLTAIMITVVATILLISVNILSTGINPFGTRILITTMFFSMIWALVSAMGFTALISVPVIGWLVFCALNFMYFFGVWGMVNNGGTF